jgi:hypothetical protein
VTTLLRPNTAVVERQAYGGTSNTGTPVNAPATTVYAALDCLIDAISALRGFELTSAGGSQPITIGSHMLVADGANITGTPGAGITYNGVAMIFSANGRAAFPDIRKGDLITKEDGTQYRVIGVHLYSDVSPNLQAELQLGKAWADPTIT